jgi:hypothetical protein
MIKVLVLTISEIQYSRKSKRNIVGGENVNRLKRFSNLVTQISVLVADIDVSRLMNGQHQQHHHP